MSFAWQDPELPQKPKRELPLFDGATFVPERDGRRLATQTIRVFNLMCDGKWRTLEQIASALNYRQASISARLRDLRKKRFGSHTVNRQYIDKGLFEYQVIERKGL